jgi:hypothetical protein
VRTVDALKPLLRSCLEHVKKTLDLVTYEIRKSGELTDALPGPQQKSMPLVQLLPLLVDRLKFNKLP